MSDKRPPGKPPAIDGKAAAKAVRLEREAAALRTNLRKRKEQAREREAAGDPSKQD
jgi:hypothetical protein